MISNINDIVKLHLLISNKLTRAEENINNFIALFADSLDLNSSDLTFYKKSLSLVKKQSLIHATSILKRLTTISEI